jgi:peptide/nickel transport system ATP-binding protein
VSARELALRRVGAGARGRRRRPRALRPLPRPVPTGRACCRSGHRVSRRRPLNEPLLRTVELTRHFRIGGLLSSKTLHAVDDVEFTIERAEIVALVGESGSGKSTIARLLALIYHPTNGEIYFEERPLSRLRSRKQRLAYSGDVPLVFQDPYAAINPAYRVTHGINRALKLHRPDLGYRQRQGEVERVLDAVGLVPPGDIVARFPHELSGGQRQRIGFAQALALRPKLIVADEPVSMLDVSIRIGILNLMSELRDREGVSFLYITHDVGSARYIADRVLVLYAGHIVEEGPTEEVIQRPKHPYTQLLLSAVPDPRSTLLGLADTTDVGEPPKVVDPGEGCRFRSRCPFAIARCETETPRLRALGQARLVACHVAELDRERAPALARARPSEDT